MQQALFFQPAFPQAEKIPTLLLPQNPGFSTPHRAAHTIHQITVIPILTPQSILLASNTIMRLPKVMAITFLTEVTRAIMGI